MAEHELQPSGSPPGYIIASASYTPRPCQNCGYSIPQSDTQEDPLPGWPIVTKVIVDHPGLEAFPSFRDLNIKSLLYYQAELDHLRTKLQKREWKDHGSPPGDNLDLAARVDDLLFCKDLSGDARAQIDLITEIRKVLNKYSTFSLMFRRIFLNQLLP
jgi:hypothetical protein